MLSVKNEGLKCKWRLLRMILPFHVEQTPIPQDDDTFIGGNGLVPNPDQDRRLWEYMCLVNDSLTSGSDDGLSYKRVYMTVFKQNAHKTHPLWTVDDDASSVYPELHEFGGDGTARQKVQDQRARQGARRRLCHCLRNI